MAQIDIPDKKIGWQRSALMIISFLLAIYLAYQVAFYKAPVGLAPIGFIFRYDSWSQPPAIDLLMTLFITGVSLFVFAISILMRNGKALMWSEGAVIICFAPSFLTYCIFNWIVPALLIVSGVMLIKNERVESATIINILIPVPFMAFLFSLPGYLIAI